MCRYKYLNIITFEASGVTMSIVLEANTAETSANRMNNLLTLGLAIFAEKSSTNLWHDGVGTKTALELYPPHPTKS
jgi:spore coat protein U-like protein